MKFVWLNTEILFVHSTRPHFFGVANNPVFVVYVVRSRMHIFKKWELFWFSSVVEACSLYQIALVRKLHDILYMFAVIYYVTYGNWESMASKYQCNCFYKQILSFLQIFKWGISSKLLWPSIGCHFACKQAAICILVASLEHKTRMPSSPNIIIPILWINFKERMIISVCITC